VFRYKKPHTPTKVTLPEFPLGLAAMRWWPHPPVGWPQSWPVPPFGVRTYGTLFPQLYELLFWVRGGFRSAQVGRACLQQVMDRLKDVKFFEPRDGRFLFARFPRAGGTTGDSFQRAVWTTFFNDYDFASYRLPDEVAKWEIRVRYPRPEVRRARVPHLRPDAPTACPPAEQR
jgi:hypothetical protein